MEQIIYLDPTDDILTIRDRLNLAEAKRVLLVIPPYSEVLRSRVDLRLVQRQAEQLRLEVALVTRDGQVRRAAQEINLPIFNSAEQGQKRLRWQREEDDPWTPGRRAEAWDAAAARRGRQLSRPWQLFRSGLAWIMFIGVFAVFGLTALLTVPSAQVTLIPHSEPINVTMFVALDPNLDKVDVANARIPGEYISVEMEGTTQIATTGKKYIPAANAAGRVILINQLGVPVNVPQGTVVRTSAFGQAIRFFITTDITVPGGFGAQAEAPIEAMEPGEVGNVGANLINEIEGVAAISVKVTNPTPTGGGGSREVPAVTQEDRDRAKAQLMKMLVQDAYFQMQNELGEQEFIPLESLFVGEVLDETYDRFVTEEAAVLTLQMRATVLGLKIGMQDANTLVYAEMVTRVPPGYDLIADGLVFKRGEIVLPTESGGDILLQMTGEGFIAARFDQEKIRQGIAGKPVDDAVQYLMEELPLQVGPQVEVRPMWLGRVPWLPVRIEINIKTQA